MVEAVEESRWAAILTAILLLPCVFFLTILILALPQPVPSFSNTFNEDEIGGDRGSWPAIFTILIGTVVWRMKGQMQGGRCQTANFPSASASKFSSFYDSNPCLATTWYCTASYLWYCIWTAQFHSPLPFPSSSLSLPLNCQYQFSPPKTFNHMSW